jgi:hypothetical protein
MKKFTIDDVPHDVQMVWVINWLGQPVGMEMYERIQQIIMKYPEWFPEKEEHEVHNP